jgi:hypothetical protein
MGKQLANTFKEEWVCSGVKRDAHALFSALAKEQIHGAVIVPGVDGPAGLSEYPRLFLRVHVPQGQVFHAWRILGMSRDSFVHAEIIPGDPDPEDKIWAVF